MHLTARARHELARRPWIHWCVVGALAAGAAWSVAAALAGVEQARDAWGSTVDVVVATRPVAPGDALAGATSRRAVPAAVVPDAAVDALPDGATSRQHVGPGEIVTAADVAAGDGPAALAPRGTRVVTLPEALPGTARVGDRVVVAADGVELAEDAVVVGVVDGAVLVAVPAERAAVVAAAATGADGVALLLVP